jgi:hypothetical protein
VLATAGQTSCELSGTHLFEAAQRELGCFLSAASEAFGNEIITHAADAWIRSLKDADVEEAFSQKGFRRITIKALARLAGELIPQR